MNRKKIALIMMLGMSITIYKCNLFSMRSPKPLEQLASKKIAATIQSLWNNAWKQYPTDFDAVMKQINAYLDKTPKVALIEDPFRKNLFTMNQSDIYKLLLKTPIQIFEDAEGIFDPTGNFIAIDQEEGIRIINLATMQPILTIQEAEFETFNHDGSRFFTFDKTNEITTYEQSDDSFKKIKSLATNELAANELEAVDPLNKYFITLATINEKDQNPETPIKLIATVWDNDFNKIKEIQLPLGGGGIQFTQNGNFIIQTSSEIQYIERKNLLKNNMSPYVLKKQPETFISNAHTTVFNNKELLAFELRKYRGGAEEENDISILLVYDLVTKKRVRKLGPFEVGPFGTLRFSPDGALLAFTSLTQVYIWNLKKDFKQTILTSSFQNISDVIFNETSSLLAAISLDGTLFLYDLLSEKPTLITQAQLPKEHYYLLYFSKAPFISVTNDTMCDNCKLQAEEENEEYHEHNDEGGGPLHLYFFPEPDTLSLEQLFYLLAIAQASDRNLSEKQIAELKQSLQKSSLVNQFKEPWLKEYVLKLVAAL